MPFQHSSRAGASKLLEGLAEISRAIMSRDYVDDILALIVSVTAQMTGSKICSILLLDKESRELTLRSCHSNQGRYNQRSNTPLGMGIAGRVAQTNMPVKVLDVRTDTRFINKEIAIHDGLVSLLSVPMSADGEVIGVLNCYTPREHDFSDEEISVLTTVAGQAAVLIRTTELRILKEIIERELEERKNIEQAKEIISEKKGVSAKQAYALLRKHSMNTRTSLAKIAESIVLASAID
jgi:GAF domain-containing protein